MQHKNKVEIGVKVKNGLKNVFPSFNKSALWSKKRLNMNQKLQSVKHRAEYPGIYDMVFRSNLIFEERNSIVGFY